MARIAVRRAAARSTSSTTGTMVLGLGLGAVLGYLLSRLSGPTPEFRGESTGSPREMSGLVRAAQAVLDDDVLLHDCHLQVLAAGVGRIEVHGWVPDRRSRARAAHLLGDSVSADAIINCLLVRGEDEDFDMADETADEQSA